MERLAAFIPQIRQANEELQSREPRSYCIDLVGADDDPNGGSKEVPSPPSDQTDTEMPMIEMVPVLEIIRWSSFNAICAHRAWDLVYMRVNMKEPKRRKRAYVKYVSPDRTGNERLSLKEVPQVQMTTPPHPKAPYGS